MTFRRTVQLAKRAVVTAVLLAAPSALMAQPVPFDAEGNSAGAYSPDWTAALADRFPACQSHEAGEISAAVIVVRQSAEVRRMSTDAAYAINTDDDRANDLWVVGTCS